ncbi:hypothetical protein Hpkin68_00360 [Helicobacter pylori]
MGWSGCEIIDNILITIAIISYYVWLGGMIILSVVGLVRYFDKKHSNKFISIHGFKYPSKYKNIRFGSVFIGY